ncbi:MAG: hypothetical protein RIC35_16785 [Marinoscillum sp.]
MKMIKMMILFAAVLSVGVLSSCGGGDGDDPKSDKEILLEALVGTWNIDASASQFANTELDGSGISATFSETGFQVTGLADYCTGGSYTVSDAGAITSVDVNGLPAELTLDGTPTATVNSAKTTITIVFSTQEAGGRTNGLGDWKLVFNKAS